jgi:hypothetical protein
MNILNILVTQRRLKRLEQVDGIVKSIQNNEYIEPIDILQGVDGTLVCEEGHHRLAAYYLAGKEQLEDFEYNLLYAESYRPHFGSVKDLIDRSTK